ncbi:retrovirus-related pol polyprotein from transposon TNT 1-94, partial [Tanacetum coccineum]
RLVAKGYTQLYGVDYEETFSPVTDIRAIRILISIVAYYDYEIWQMDIKTAFLNGYLDEDIYMVQPEGFVDPDHPRKVCKLQRSIYGLKQVSRSWNDEEIVTPPFLHIAAEANLGSLRIHIEQRIAAMIGYRGGSGGCFEMKSASTPEEVKRMQNVHYASAMGSIMYANLGEPHWTTVKNILKYLRNTKDMFLVYGGNPEAELRVDCYCNAGFETDIDDMKSLTGYLHKLNYIAASEAEMEAVWIRKFISGLGIVPTINEPIKMFCDNSAALLFANEPGVQMGARHYHRSNLLKVHTDNNLAYPFTKALPKGKLTQHARSMGLRLASSFM